MDAQRGNLEKEAERAGEGKKDHRGGGDRARLPRVGRSWAQRVSTPVLLFYFSSHDPVAHSMRIGLGVMMGNGRAAERFQERTGDGERGVSELSCIYTWCCGHHSDC